MVETEQGLLLQYDRIVDTYRFTQQTIKTVLANFVRKWTGMPKNCREQLREAFERLCQDKRYKLHQKLVQCQKEGQKILGTSLSAHPWKFLVRSQGVSILRKVDDQEFVDLEYQIRWTFLRNHSLIIDHQQQVLPPLQQKQLVNNLFAQKDEDIFVRVASGIKLFISSDLAQIENSLLMDASEKELCFQEAFNNQF